jgi:two-component system, NtrC family, sensor kinase
LAKEKTERKINPHYRILKFNFVLIIVAVSIAPLILVGGILDRYHTSSYRLKAQEHLKELVQKHAQNIDRFLVERLGDIKFISDSFSFEQLNDEILLGKILQTLQLEYGPSFVDLGIVDETGKQIAYAGPFQLDQARYSDAKWFREAIRSDRYVSDVFLGLRGQPHFIVAVRSENALGKWVLRATVDFDAFNTLVENLRIGETGFAYILNRAGEFQTKPMVEIGADKAAYLKELFNADHPGEKNVRIDINRDASGQKRIYVAAFLKNQNWLLIYQQKTEDAFSDITRTRKIAIFVVFTGLICIVAISLLLSRKMIDHLIRADQEKELMNQQVIETGKLASVGELAAGIAHEINNPVAIMVEEAGWIHDLLEEEEFRSGKNLAEFERALAQIKTQGTRCKEITHKLLSFARKTDSRIQELQVNELIEDVVALSTQRAKYGNVTIRSYLAPGLPAFWGSQTEMQQIFLNLINNALDAMEKEGGTLALTTTVVEGHIAIDVTDDGPGIPEANLARIFDPFFTTKPVGKGTGLGLSICFGIVQRMGGDITVTSRPGQGTTFRIKLLLKGD